MLFVSMKQLQHAHTHTHVQPLASDLPPSLLSPSPGGFVVMQEKIPELVVPSLEGFEVRTYLPELAI